MKAITFQSMADRKKSLTKWKRIIIRLASTMSFRWFKEWVDVTGMYLETAQSYPTAANLFTQYWALVLKVNRSNIQAMIVSSFLMDKEQWIWMMCWRVYFQRASALPQLAQTSLPFLTVKISSLICKLTPNSLTFFAKRKSSSHSIGFISGLILRQRRANLLIHY